jgi:CRP-like cAMP-binding protein
MIDPKQIDRLVPLDGLGAERLQKLLTEAAVEPIKAGKEIFQEGDQDPYTLYLLEGEVTLSSKTSGARRSVQGGSDEARYALSNLKPRQFTGKTASAARLLRVDSALLDSLLAWDQMSGSGIEVEEIGGDAADTAWMRRLYESRALLRLPSANLEQLFTRFEEVPMKAGQIVIRQGDKGDYYYAIKHGRCRVVQKPGDQQKMVALADLDEGDGFGEEALLSDAPRNATIAALTDGVLMRLAKEDFLRLLKEPLVERVTDREAVERVRAGAGLIDVRLEAEFRRANLKGSINIPLARLRQQADGLDRNHQYIVYCDTGRRSTAAAFLLSERGFNVAVLKDGINALVKANPAAA